MAEVARRAASLRERWRLQLRGAVQGVGLRPFVLRLATRFGVVGAVRNVGATVEIEAEAAPAVLRDFVAALVNDAPLAARGVDLRHFLVDLRNENSFTIAPSTGLGLIDVPPDVATCADCLAELHDPANRRHRYAFTHCALCGPRWSLLEQLPWDRAATTMRAFTPCADCAAEYADPQDRRCHAQTICCPACGPRLVLTDAAGRLLADDAGAVDAAVAALRAGRIVAVKGVGGFQLWVRAADAAAVERLRRRKRRPHKPFAVMVTDGAMAAGLARLDAPETALLHSPAAPIVLLAAHSDGRRLARAVAPDVPALGLMLPSSPLQTLLCAALGEPVVATSGNLTGEPICIGDDEARTRLGAIADCFLGHDRQILRALDDSVARVIDGRPQILRVGRGYAPLQFSVSPTLVPGIALGGDLKAAVAVSLGDRLVLSQHLGDLALRESQRHYAAALAEHLRMSPATTHRWLRDMHPGYHVNECAPVDSLEVQHHAAHAHACLVEHGATLARPFLAFTWDGSGHGADGSLWGGECLRVDGGGRWTRLASIEPFRLPGGAAAIREPRRIAFALLAACGLNGVATPAEAAVWARQLDTGFNAPWTTSIGRLFDGVGALLALRDGGCVVPSYEGQLALALEAHARAPAVAPYPLPLLAPVDALPRLDWRPLIRALHADLAAGRPSTDIAAAFHAALSDGLCATLRALSPDGGARQVALAGGVFQNRVLLEHAIGRLRAAGYTVVWPERIPINDGGLAAGQLLAGCTVVADH